MSGDLTHPVSVSVRKSLSWLGITIDSKILVGVSGGMDSMSLLYILHRFGYHVSAAHVNFNLRGAESINDALFVSKWCLDQGIPYYELSKDTKAIAEDNNQNTQTAARNIRYEWWEYLVHTHQFEFVATAHHLDDTIETLLLNLFRGTGIKGLRGIPLHRDFFIRPLLECPRSSIASFVTAFDIPYRTDESNLTDHYQRNKLRHHVIPLLEELYPGLHSSLKQTMHRINIEWESMDQAYHDWVAGNITPHLDGFLIQSGNSSLSFLLRWLEEKGLPWMLSYDFLTAPNADSGHVLRYVAYKLSRTKKGFYFEESAPAVHIKIHKPGRFSFGNFELAIDTISADEFMPGKDPWTQFVNEEVIQWPLHIRNVEPGDSFQPLGMDGKTKKIQDLMVDSKLEMYEKERLLLLSNDHHILWVMGLRLDERAKVRSGDKRIYRLKYTPVLKD